MPSYACKIGTSDGRIVDKLYESTSRDQLRANLEEQGFHVFRIRLQGLGLLGSLQGQNSRLSGTRFLAFNQELLVLLRSGLPVMQIFETQIEQQEAGAFRDVLSEIREEIRGGSDLSDAFAKFPRTFPTLYVAALKAGEKTGDLAETLSRYLAYQKRVEAIRAKVRGAAFYPLLLTIAAIVVVVFLMIFVVPRFSEIYADANVELPLMTRALLGVSDLVVGYWYCLPAVAGAGLVGARLLRSSHKGRLWLDRARLRLPFFGALAGDYALSGFGRTLATILASGTPLVQALHMSRGTLNNASLEQDLVRAIRRVEEGTSLTEALRQTGFFPLLALRMISVGESTGSLTTMLADLADYYETQVEAKLARLTTLIEPLLMMTMGLLIAFIIVAMYVPIFQLAGTVG